VSTSEVSTTAPVSRGGRQGLLAAAAVTALLFAVPGGDLVGRPLVWVSTLFHEMGHAVATSAVGGDVVAVRVYADGSGVTQGRRPPGRVRAAVVAAGGLVGPAAFAGVLFAAGRRRRFVRPASVALGAALLLAVPFTLRGAIAVLLGVVLGALAVVLGTRARPAVAQFALLFLAVQLALSVFSRREYLFASTAQTGIGPVPSDSAQIATALGGPYWFWGAVCGLVSVAILVVGLLATLREQPGR
jgi:hypothetical protein